MRKAAATVDRKGYWVPMVGNALRILETFDDPSVELSLHEINARTRVHKTSALRILVTMGKLGYVVRSQETGRYQLGLKVVEIARRFALGQNLVHISRPFLKNLHAQFNETVNLAVLRNMDIVYVDILESTQSFRMASEVGSRVPLQSTALGKSIGAFLPSDKLQCLLDTVEFTRHTHRTIMSRAQFLKELVRVRQRGYSLDNEETEIGAFCIAVPIVSGQGEAVGAVSLSGPTRRMRARWRAMVRRLKKATASMSNTLAALAVC
jgi:DNA-binding IclR family transcriptional regulator